MSCFCTSLESSLLDWALTESAGYLTEAGFTVKWDLGAVAQEQNRRKTTVVNKAEYFMKTPEALR
jgi:hypothetical protein